MKLKIVHALWLGPVVLFGVGGHGDGRTQSPDWAPKVDRWVIRTAEGGAKTEFLLFLTVQADLEPAGRLSSKAAKGAFVYQELTAIAAATQPPVIAELEALGAEFKPFWVANMIWVRGDLPIIEKMAERMDIARVSANPRISLPAPPPSADMPLDQAPSAIEWNINKIGAPQVWTSGYRGQGVVVGGQDTGYDWDHPALINQYRGWNGASVDHNYSWHDAVHGAGGDLKEPYDDHGHGTHTMGTIAGNDLAPSQPSWPAGAANAVGVAPGSKWIGCRNMKSGLGTPATYSECYQWFIAPTNLDGQNPDPALAPDIINNSWSCPPSEGCTDPDILLTVVANVRAAGILTVHSAGNSGPACGTINAPAGIYEESFTVAATDSSDSVAGFSSRGPVTLDGSGRMKPDVSAPGVAIRSSIPDGGYQSMSGTSMAGPHAAGLAALMLSAHPAMAGNVAGLEYAMTRTAVPKTTSQGCGGDEASAVPNNVYGWGRIHAPSAVEKILSSGKKDLVGTWDGQGVYARSSETGAWTALASPADLIVCGDLGGDGQDDLIGIWGGQNGVWVRNSADGAWAFLSNAARRVAAGDMNGDRRVDFLGTWDGQGVYYKDSVSGSWVLMATPADLLAAGDLDGDGKDDLVGVWPSQAGVWTKLSKAGTWSYLGSAASDIAAGDMNGDGRVDFLGTWAGQGVFYNDSISGEWVKMASPAGRITAGDLDNDGFDDLIGLWPGQAGIWVKYSRSQTWAYIGSTARDIAVGRMAGGAWSQGFWNARILDAPLGGTIPPAGIGGVYMDLSSEGPGGSGFRFQTEGNLVAGEPRSRVRRLPGPGESGFMFKSQKNLSPERIN